MLGLEKATDGERPADRFLERSAVLRVDHRDERLVHRHLERLDVDAVDPVELSRPAHDAAPDVPLPASDVCQRLGLEQPSFARTQGALHLLACPNLYAQVLVRLAKLLGPFQDAALQLLGQTGGAPRPALPWKRS